MTKIRMMSSGIVQGRAWLIVLCLGSVLGFAVGVDSPVIAQEPVPPVRPQDLMRLKLESAQRVLASLALEDYPAIKRDAQRLHLLSLETGWNVLQTKQYLESSESFRRSVLQLSAAADEGNVDAAGLAYVRLSLTCIECHKHMRRERASATPAAARE
ncbi:MAG: hypothetical protein KDA60_18200 [Planctomycetales bacterium]|nr:hypothetical protein [Planctomycetales bacterium]